MAHHSIKGALACSGLAPLGTWSRVGWDLELGPKRFTGSELEITGERLRLDLWLVQDLHILPPPLGPVIQPVGLVDW